MKKCNKHKDLLFNEKVYLSCPLCKLQKKKLLKTNNLKLPPNFITAKNNDIVTENFIYYNERKKSFYHLKFLDFPTQKTVKQVKFEFKIDQMFKLL
jgi:hypothetical protein